MTKDYLVGAMMVTSREGYFLLHLDEEVGAGGVRIGDTTTVNGPS